MKVESLAVIWFAYCFNHAITSGEVPEQHDGIHSNRSEKCPESNSRYAIGGTAAGLCTNKYVECENDIATEKLCPDGLYFNEEIAIEKYPCQHLINANCTLRAPIGTPQVIINDCPLPFGFYKLGNASICNEYTHCHYGRPYNYSCPFGLAFNPNTHQCDWPDLVNECDAEAFLKYKCPNPSENRTDSAEIKFYKTDDCQRYFRCKNGRPRLLVCGNGTAFEQTLNRCEAAQNVTGCEYLILNHANEKVDITAMRYFIILFRSTRIIVKLFILSAFFF